MYDGHMKKGQKKTNEGRTKHKLRKNQRQMKEEEKMNE